MTTMITTTKPTTREEINSWLQLTVVKMRTREKGRRLMRRRSEVKKKKKKKKKMLMKVKVKKKRAPVVVATAVVIVEAARRSVADEDRLDARPIAFASLRRKR